MGSSISRSKAWAMALGGVAIFGVTGVARAAFTNTLVDGGFESGPKSLPDSGGAAQWNSFAGNGSGGQEPSQTSAYNIVASNPHSGSDAATDSTTGGGTTADPTAVMYQRILDPDQTDSQSSYADLVGRTINWSFWAKTTAGGTMSYDFDARNADFNTINGGSFGTIPATDTAYTFFSGSFVVTADTSGIHDPSMAAGTTIGPNELSVIFSNANGTPGTIFIDDVTFAPAAVPEPASAGLLAAGAAVGLLRRRRAAAR